MTEYKTVTISIKDVGDVVFDGPAEEVDAVVKDYEEAIKKDYAGFEYQTWRSEYIRKHPTSPLWSP